MEEIQLKDICDLDNGYAFKSDDYIDNSNTLNCRMSNIRPDGSFDILYSAKYLPDDFAEKYKDYILHDGDLIIAMTDMAGDPKILGVPTVVDTQGYCLLLNQRVGRLRFIRDGVNADYLKLALQCPKVRTYLKRFAGGGVQLNVSKKDILSAPVCMRNEEEQNHIAGLFKRVLEVKTKREQELQLLDDLIKARFVEMFGDPEQNEKGWRTCRLGDECTVINGRAYKAEELLDEGKYRVLRVGNFFTNDSWYYSDLELDNEKYCDEGDLLFAWSASFGPRIWHGEKVIYHYHIWKLIGYENCLNKDFFVELLNYNCDVMKRGTHGSTMLHFTKSQMEDQLLILPPMQLQEQFADFVHQVDKSKVAVQKSLDETQQLFDSLMQKYFG